MAELSKREKTYQRADEDRPRNSLRFPHNVKGLLLGEAIDAYHREHAHRRKASTYYVTETLNQFMACNAIQENFPMIALQKHHCKVYKELLLNGGAAGRRRKPGPVTINRKLSAVQHFVKWAMNNEHMETDIMAGLALPARLVSSSRTRKEAFSDAELSSILKSLAPCRTHDDAMRREWYWAVLLLMHSGCRALEVIQLLKTDVKPFDGIWCLDLVGSGEGRQLKNRESVRKVPIHSSVLTSGFLAWQQQQSGPRLFPALFSYGSIKTTQWFSALLEQLKVKRAAVTLHSLRHTVTVKLAQARTYPPLQNRILGHAVGKSVEERVYMASLNFSVKELSEAIEKITFPVL